MLREISAVSITCPNCDQDMLERVTWGPRVGSIYLVTRHVPVPMAIAENLNQRIIACPHCHGAFIVATDPPLSGEVTLRLERAERSDG